MTKKQSAIEILNKMKDMCISAQEKAFRNRLYDMALGCQKKIDAINDVLEGIEILIDEEA